MKTKLNLTINSKLIPRSKSFAKKQGKSVSQVVEELLAKAIEEDKSSFSNKWLGKLELSDNQSNRSDYLKNRYQL